MTPTIRTPYTRVRSSVDFSNVESVTDTSFGNDTDVNHIVARFHRDGTMPTPTQDQCQYADVTGLQKDLTTLIQESNEALDKVKEAQAAESARKQSEITEMAAKAAKYEEMLQQQKEAEKAESPIV